MGLPDDERAELAVRLLASVDEPPSTTRRYALVVPVLLGSETRRRLSVGLHVLAG